jgi:hypothetical protein
MNHNTSATCKRLSSAESLTLAYRARVVEWQTRTFEGRMPKGMRVQVPPRALLFLPMEKAVLEASEKSI